MPTNPPIKNTSSRKLLSYATQPAFPYTDNVVNPAMTGARTDFKQGVEPGETIRLTGNVMVDTNETNVINLSIDNRDNVEDIDLTISYNVTNDSGNASTKFITTATAGEVFFQQYPTENRYVMVEADGFSLKSNVTVNGSVRLSKFTQFNTSSQLRDGIDRNKLAINDRAVNNYYEDIALGRVRDIILTTQNSDMELLPSSNGVHIVGNGEMRVPSFFTNYPLTDTKVFLVSDSPDTNPVSISGMSSNGSFHTEQIDLTGTSNSASSIHNYRIVSPMLGSATGNVSCNSVVTGELMNYIEANNYISGQCIFGSNIHQTTVIKNLHYTANIDDRGAVLKLVKYNVLGQSEVLHRHKIIDEQLNIDLGLFNYIVNPNEVIVVLLEHNGAHPSLNFVNKVNVKLDLVAHSDTLNFF